MLRISNASIQPFESEHIAAVRRAAPECMVLLRHDGSFPVQPGRIAAFGSGVRHTVKGGTGSGDVNVRAFSTVEQGLISAGFELTSGAWLDAYDRVLADAQTAFQKHLEQIQAEDDAPLATFGLTMLEPEYDLDLTAEGDMAIYVLARNSGEGADRRQVAGDINLTRTEIRDIRALSARYKRFMLVLNVGGLVDLTPVKDVQNILLMSQLGSPTGDALADVLCGKAYPSGKLTMTWAPIADYPSTQGFGDPDDTRYTEGVFVGYRYFDSFGVTPAYPFGYGLGYTTFASRSVSFSADEDRITVGIEVENTGHFAGKEVIQVYYSAPDGKLPKPVKELAAFRKTKELQPGEKQTLSISFPTVQMNAYDADQAAYIMEPGVYEIFAGACSDAVQPCGRVLLDREVVTQQLRNVGGSPDFEDMRPSSAKPPVSAEHAIRLDAQRLPTTTAVYDSDPIELQGKAGTWADLAAGRLTLEEFVGGLTNEQLAYLCIGNFKDAAEGASVWEVVGNASSHLAGAAGETTNRLQALGVPSLTMPDGPAGLRLSTEYVVRGEEVLAAVSSQAGFGQDHDVAGEKVYYQYCVALPIGTALAQAWNPELCESCGSLIGTEMELFGANLWLAPALNIYRNPMCGRNFEYYSEDPVVAGTTAAAITAGVQKHPGCATTIKHYCCNNQETNRMHSNSILSERALREIYLKGFEICVRQAQPHCVMSSYNLVNGQHTNNRRCLQTWVLRDEWGFEGFVMTDWLTTLELGAAQKYPKASASGCIKAGNDMVMPGVQCDFDDLMRALQDENHPDHLTRAHLQQDAKRVLRVISILAGKP